MNTAKTVFIGLDVSKLTIDVCVLLPDGRRMRIKIPNSINGFEELLQWLLNDIEVEQIHACLEPTGPYSKGIAYFLAKAGIYVSLVNSYAVLNHGRSRKIRSKNDRIDAFLLADYGLKHTPPQWHPPTDTARQVKEIQHRLTSIDEAIRQEENRLEAGAFCTIVLEDIRDSLGKLYVRKKALEKEILKVLKGDDRLTAHFEILQSIIGIGETTAVRLLALIDFEQFQSGRQVGCFSGLSPREYESGTSVHRHPTISRIGDPVLRSALYFPAMVAMQHNPQLREFAQRLKAKGKPPKVIICAVMRKLLVLAHALIRKQEMYTATHRSPMAAAP